jgi:nicotinamidase-related amidase
MYEMYSESAESIVGPNWSRAALVTIDMQNDFALPTGTCFVPGTDAILSPLLDLIGAFRNAQFPIFHAIRLYEPDGSNAERCRRDLLRAGVSIARPGTPGSMLVDDFGLSGDTDTRALLSNRLERVGLNEWVFYKPRWSAFFNTGLQTKLDQLSVDTIVVAGCNFPNCPSATLFDATERDFRVVLAIDAVSGISEIGIGWCSGIGVTALRVQQIKAELLAFRAQKGQSR